MTDAVPGELVSAGGMQWHVVEHGDPSAPPLLLLHGLPETWECWRHQIPALAEHFRVLAIDNKGYGRTDRPDDDYSGPFVARQIHALLDELGVDRIRLAGHDWGACIADFVATERPERIVAYAHLCAPLHTYDPANAPHHELFKNPEIAIPVMQSPQFMEQVFATSCKDGAIPLTEVELAHYTAEWNRPGGVEAVVRYFNEMRIEERQWARMTFPTLVATGDSDPRQPLHYVDGLDDVIPGLREVVVVPDAGHFITHEQPEFVTATLLRFFLDPLELR